MSTATWITDLGSKPVTAADTIMVALPPSRSPGPSQGLHRLGEVRRREGLTRREVARRLGVSIREVQHREQPSSDMPLSDLYRWQEALEVPLGELLSEPVGELSPPVQLRAATVADDEDGTLDSRSGAAGVGPASGARRWPSKFWRSCRNSKTRSRGPRSAIGGGRTNSGKRSAWAFA